MAFAHGKDAVVKLDNAAGTLTDVTQYVTKVTVTRNGRTADVTTLNDDWDTFVAGLKGATIGLEGPFDPTFGTIANAAVGAQKTFEYNPQGTGTGLPKATMEAIATQYGPSSDTQDATKWTLELVATGAITDATN